jgi:type II secretory pathway component PulK
VNQGKKAQGIALMSVLFIAAVMLILASTFIFTIVRERQSATASKLMNDSVQTADAVSERARMQILEAFDDSYLTPTNFLLELRKGSSGFLSSSPLRSASREAMTNPSS